MARRTVTEMKPLKDKGLRGYEAIWSHIRQKGSEHFTLTDIDKLTNAKRQTVRDYLMRLVRAGFVERLENKRGDEWVYKAVKRPLKAPRIRRDGGIVKQGAGRDQMWRTMKMLRTFTAKDLAISASTEEVRIKVTSAEDYLKFLCRAGYLKISTPHKDGYPDTSRKATYRFIESKNTGPAAPMIQRVKRVYDPNLEEVVWPADGGDHV